MLTPAAFATMELFKAGSVRLDPIAALTASDVMERTGDIRRFDIRFYRAPKRTLESEVMAKVTHRVAHLALSS